MAFVALPPIEFDDPYEPLYLDLADQGFGRHEGLGSFGEHPMTAAELPHPDMRLMARWGNAALPFDAPAIASIDGSHANRGLREAMDCKTAPIPADDAGDAPDAIAKEGYDLTHLLSGYRCAKKVGCAYPLKEAQIAAILGLDSP